jgi:hypothetical protein
VGRWSDVSKLRPEPYIVAGRVFIVALSERVGFISVELRFSAADATKPPAPRVDDGISHGMEGFVEECS